MGRAVTLTDCVKEWLKISPNLIAKYELQFRGHSFTLVSLLDQTDKYRIKFHIKVMYPKKTMGPSRMVIWRCTDKGLGTALKFEISINDDGAELLDARAKVLDSIKAVDPEFFTILGNWLKSIVVE